MAGVNVKKYIGATGDALAYAWEKFRGVGEEAPPLGSANTIPPTAPPVGAAIGGISMGTILIAGIAYMFLKR